MLTKIKRKKPKKRVLVGELLESIPSKGLAIGFFIVCNDKGLHTRPCTELVKCATRFKSQITLTYQDNTVNAKSILGILTLAAHRGARIVVQAQGEDAEAAIQHLIELARNKFYIHY